MDFNFIIKQIPLYLKATQLTVLLAFLGIILSLIIGFFCSWARYYKIPILNQFSGLYIELSRNTPLIIHLFFLYFALPKIGINLSSYNCAIIGLSFLGGSYMAEAMRGGLEAVEKIQLESGLSLGLSKIQLMRYIILPQAFSVSLPAIGANIIFLIKETSLFSVIALADLMFVAKDLSARYHKNLEAYLMLIVAYLIILLPLSYFLSKFERRLRHGQFGY